jgi:hypothetical protein
MMACPICLVILEEVNFIILKHKTNNVKTIRGIYKLSKDIILVIPDSTRGIAPASAVIKPVITCIASQVLI